MQITFSVMSERRKGPEQSNMAGFFRPLCSNHSVICNRGKCMSGSGGAVKIIHCLFPRVPYVRSPLSVTSLHPTRPTSQLLTSLSDWQVWQCWRLLPLTFNSQEEAGPGCANGLPSLGNYNRDPPGGGTLSVLFHLSDSRMKAVRFLFFYLKFERNNNNLTHKFDKHISGQHIYVYCVYINMFSSCIWDGSGCWRCHFISSLQVCISAVDLYK